MLHAPIGSSFAPATGGIGSTAATTSWMHTIPKVAAQSGSNLNGQVLLSADLLAVEPDPDSSPRAPEAGIPYVTPWFEVCGQGREEILRLLMLQKFASGSAEGARDGAELLRGTSDIR